MQAMESATPASALRLGLLLSAANPKILVLAAAGGLAIGAAELTVAQTIGAIARLHGDRLLHCGTAMAPLPPSRRPNPDPLGRTRDWLKAHNAAIMAVVLTVLGVLLIIEGLSSL